MTVKTPISVYHYNKKLIESVSKEYYWVDLFDTKSKLLNFVELLSKYDLIDKSIINDINIYINKELMKN